MFVDFAKDFEPLYHFTSFESAIRILASHKIRFGKMNRLNDPLESFRTIYVSSEFLPDNDAFDIIPIIKEELNHYQQISFVGDRKNIAGFSLNHMWGNYADNGYGVCIVFDKRYVIEGLVSANYGYVKNKRNYDPSIVLKKLEGCDQNFVAQYIRRRVKSTFFYKSKEWECEQEFRIVQRFDIVGDYYLNLGEKWNDAIKCVVFCKAHDIGDGENVFNSSSFLAISRLIPSQCRMAQFTKDLEGYNILYDAKGDTLWGEIPVISECE